MAVFALVGGIAFSEDLDVRALQAKLAAQEARLNDLQAKMNSRGGNAGTADDVVSLRKNAKVVIGGDFNARIYHYEGKIKEDLGAGFVTTSKLQATDHRVNDVKLRVKVDVNDYFEAYFRFDFRSGESPTTRHDDNWKQAQTAYVRWKNLCNSGFSILVGRNDLVFAGGAQHGATWSGFYGGAGESSINKLSGNIVAGHVGFDHSRTNQITGAWENPDGTFKAELSYFQAVDKEGQGDNRYTYSTVAGGVTTYHSNKTKSINQGFGSGSTRLTWKPIEGLTIVGSAINMHNDTDYNGYGSSGFEVANHTAVDAMIAYEPSFLPGFKVWGMFGYDWNAGWIDNVDVDKYQIGMSYRFNKLHLYTFGEYMRSDNFGFTSNGLGASRVYGDGLKTKAWAGQVGFKYFVGYGVDFDLGYRYEKHESKFQGYKYAKADLHSVHARLNFNF